MFLERGPQRENTLFTTRIDPGTFLKQIIGAAETVFDVCKRKEWVDDDLLTLETNLRQISKLPLRLPSLLCDLVQRILARGQRIC